MNFESCFSLFLIWFISLYVLCKLYYRNKKKKKKRACRSDATTSDQNKQIFYMILPRTWFKVEEFRLEWPPYLLYLFVACRFVERLTCILYQYVSSFRETIYQTVFSSVCVRWSFRLMGCLEMIYMTFLVTEMKELGQSIWNDTQHNIVDPYLSSMS